MGYQRPQLVNVAAQQHNNLATQQPTNSFPVGSEFGTRKSWVRVVATAMAMGWDWHGHWHWHWHWVWLWLWGWESFLSDTVSAVPVPTLVGIC